jgi:hypothetical protein
MALEIHILNDTPLNTQKKDPHDSAFTDKLETHIATCENTIMGEQSGKSKEAKQSM